jgi:hypothetical protein
MPAEERHRFQWWGVTAWLRQSSPARQLLTGYMLGLASFLSLLAALRLRERPARATDKPAATATGEPPSPQEVTNIYPAHVQPVHQFGWDGPIVGADAGAVRQGFEPLSTNTRVLGVLAFAFVVLLAGTLWGVWVLLHVYLAADPPDETAASAAPVLARAIASPLEPMPQHNDLDWQDLVHQRQREDAQLRRMGWTIDPTTGQAVIPPVATTANGDPLRFPPPYAPVPAGAYEPLPQADVFPPVGDAADADQLRPSAYQLPTDTPDVKDLPARTGPADRQNLPTR